MPLNPFFTHRTGTLNISLPALILAQETSAKNSGLYNIQRSSHIKYKVFWYPEKPMFQKL